MCQPCAKDVWYVNTIPISAANVEVAAPSSRLVDKVQPVVDDDVAKLCKFRGIHVTQGALARMRYSIVW